MFHERGWGQPAFTFSCLLAELVSTFSSFLLTTFISSSHVLTIPLKPSLPAALVLAATGLPRGSPLRSTLSPELHTAGLLQPHVRVGYRWWNSGSGSRSFLAN